MKEKLLACDASNCRECARLAAIRDRWVIAGLVGALVALVVAAAWLAYLSYLIGFGGFFR